MSAIGAVEAGRPIAVTGTGAAQQVLPRDGVLIGFIFASGASPTIVLNDANPAGNAAAGDPVVPVNAGNMGTGAGNCILQSMIPTIGTFYNFRMSLNSGLVATISAAANVTFVVK